MDESSARCRDLYLTTHNTPRHRHHVPAGTGIRNPSKRAATDPRLRPLGHHDRHTVSIIPVIFNRETIYRPRPI